MANGERILRWQSSQRYYAARLHQDLLGDTVVDLAWGGLHNNLGGTQTLPVSDEAAGMATIATVHTTRTAHGYALVQDRALGMPPRRKL